MSRSATTAKLTYEDLLELPDDDKRHELLDGVLLPGWSLPLSTLFA